MLRGCASSGAHGSSQALLNSASRLDVSPPPPYQPPPQKKIRTTEAHINVRLRRAGPFFAVETRHVGGWVG